MKKTLYISDLDGTLLRKEARISQYAASVLNRLIERGGFFTIATSRDAKSAMKIMEGVRLRLSLVLLNGTLTYDPAEGKLLTKEIIDRQAIGRLLALLESRGESALLTSLVGEKTVVHAAESAKEQYQRYLSFGQKRDPEGFAPNLGYPDPSGSDILYATMWDREEALAPIYREALGIGGLACSFYRDVYNDGLWFLECSAERATKAHAAKRLREEGGFSWLVGFGDNLNDLPLLEACDERIAVENAREEVKASATLVIGPAEEDGVAKWIAEREGIAL
jgi:Cof subfamily protein (haloacid dehalogenase superfamily)